VLHLIDAMGASERFACRVTGQNRRNQRHQPGQSPIPSGSRMASAASSAATGGR
jgi:hypothetical protein